MNGSPSISHAESPGKPEDPADRAATLDGLINALLDARSQMLEQEAAAADDLRQIHPAHTAGARNLQHYLALRRHDLRAVQEQLAVLGLSSLGRSEAHVLQTANAVLTALHRLAGRNWRPVEGEADGVGFVEGRAVLTAHTEALLGPAPEGRSVRIMVTLPNEAAQDAGLVRDLMQQGMNIARINCAHGGPDAWAEMIRHIRQAEQERGQGCGVLMDLAGPKLRTGAVASGVSVVAWRPRRDEFGEKIAPARVWLTPADAPEAAPPGAAAALPVAREWLERRRPGETIAFQDLRGKKRKLEVAEAAGASRWAEAVKSAYIGPATLLSVKVRTERGRKRRFATAEAGPLPERKQSITLRAGDTLILTRSPIPGGPAGPSDDGTLLRPAHIPCTLPEVFSDVRAGERIALDDGKIVGVVTGVTDEELRLEVLRAGAGSAKLRADKGINLPDSDLHIPSLTEEDRANLDFVARHADIVGLSFAQDPAGIRLLQEALAERRNPPPGILLKIETRRGFEQLPHLLMTAMRSAAVGVMIARGDLAVECGYERMAEVQEEILWLCEAAHVPVVWATQVLESLAKKGIPSRAEITDAAMGERAECVMLNKGPHVRRAVAALDDILRRMQDHQQKKSAMLRKLAVSGVATER